MSSLNECSRKAHAAAAELRGLDICIRNQVLNEYADALEKAIPQLISENQKDLEQAEQNGMNTAMLDRLMLNTDRIHQMAQGIRQVSSLDDPLGIVLEERVLASGLKLKKITVPFGVIGIIYESRPNVTADCAALSFKAGSAVILKGGKESWYSSSLIASLLQNVLLKHGISKDAVQLAEHPDHDEVLNWIEDRSSVDLLLPRGSRRLIQSVVQHAKVPVIETGAGVCHVYVDEQADQNMAERITVNAKTSRPSVCNAMETLLVHRNIAEVFIPRIVTSLMAAGVQTIYGDDASKTIDSRISAANETSYSTEYDDLVMNIAIVKDVREAVSHIEHYGTHHSESIITANQDTADWFMNHVDSACVYHNASTRFTDGFEFGMGAEIGISTQKLHARGPMALKEITTYTYHIEGEGQIR